jgi:peptidoglycan-associated lipoprotein
MMFPVLAKAGRTHLRWVPLVMIACGLAGCASQSYVVLLPNDDGTTGKVLVTGRAGTTLIERHHEAASFRGAGGNTFVVSDETIAKDFGAAMAASPKKPRTYLLYFETGTTRLTPESQANIPKIIDEIAQRPAPDFSIVGHTDTLGEANANERLGMARARAVAEIIAQTKVSSERISIESHGEKNLLVHTPDNTDEPRNRRVEVTIR